MTYAVLDNLPSSLIEALRPDQNCGFGQVSGHEPYFHFHNQILNDIKTLKHRNIPFSIMADEIFDNPHSNILTFS